MLMTQFTPLLKYADLIGNGKTQYTFSSNKKKVGTFVKTWWCNLHMIARTTVGLEERDYVGE